MTLPLLDKAMNPVPRRRYWSHLSYNYQKRLLGAGVTPQQYESGINLKAARGHKTTPENKRDRIRKLAKKLFEKKERLRGDRLKWNGDNAKRIILQGVGKGEDRVQPLGESELLFLTNMSDEEFDDFLVDTDFDNEEYRKYRAAAYYH